MIEEARAAANQVKDQETQKAISQAEQIVSKAREAAQADHDRMLAGWKRNWASGRANDAAVAGKVLTDEDQSDWQKKPTSRWLPELVALVDRDLLSIP